MDEKQYKFISETIDLASSTISFLQEENHNLSLENQELKLMIAQALKDIKTLINDYDLPVQFISHH
jgi:regulator of replication initiation timing